MPLHLAEETPPAKLICAIFLTPVVALGLISLILWLGLRPHAPKFHVQEFSVPGLGQPEGFHHGNVTFNVTVRNPNRRVRILYESLDGSVYYKDGQVGPPEAVVNSLIQDPKNTTWVQRQLSGTTTISTVQNQSWSELMNDRAQGRVMFSLEFRSRMQYKKSMWDSRHHRMHAICHVGVGSDGLILPNLKGRRCAVHLK